jgi:hypothetical protein
MASADRYANKHLADPAWDAVAVTPGASALGDVTRGLYVGGAGDVEVTMASGNDVTFTAVPAGTVLPIRCTHVLSGSTTATTIIALI